MVLWQNAHPGEVDVPEVELRLGVALLGAGPDVGKRLFILGVRRLERRSETDSNHQDSDDPKQRHLRTRNVQLLERTLVLQHR